jgi:hypothetical protein
MSIKLLTLGIVSAFLATLAYVAHVNGMAARARASGVSETRAHAAALERALHETEKAIGQR